MARPGLLISDWHPYKCFSQLSNVPVSKDNIVGRPFEVRKLHFIKVFFLNGTEELSLNLLLMARFFSCGSSFLLFNLAYRAHSWVFHS